MQLAHPVWAHIPDGVVVEEIVVVVVKAETLQPLTVEVAFLQVCVTDELMSVGSQVM